MGKIRQRKWFIRSLWALAVVLLSAGVVIVRQGGAVLTGFTAKCLCSEIFVAGRQISPVMAEDVAPYSSLVSVEVDSRQRSVEAAFLGLIRSEAVFRETLGCALLNGANKESVRGQQIPAKPPKVLSAVNPWPKGRGNSTAPAGASVSGRLNTALNWAFEDPHGKRRTRAVIVVYRGGLLAERYAPGFGVDRPMLGWSMAKTVTAALAGIIIGQGHLSLELAPPLSEWSATNDPRQAITMTHLLLMESGLKWDESYLNPFSDVVRMLFIQPDTGQKAASKRLAALPGRHFQYSSGTTNLISRIIRQTIGDDKAYWQFPRQTLFNPLAMESAVFELDAGGTFVGSSYMYATARDWARFGLLLAQDGNWNGRRLLPEGWVAFMTEPSDSSNGCYGGHVWTNGPECTEDWAMGGLPEGTFSMEGHYGQFVTVIPSQELVIVRFGMTKNPQDWNQADLVRKVLSALKSEN